MVTLPIEALDADIAILGKKGGGKTFTAKGIVEQLLDMGRRVLILDPLGVWAGLRTAADGEAPGYPVAIFGGLHGDLPLDTAAAVPLAAIIAKENLPAVIDLSELSKTAQQPFLYAFLHELRRANHEALTIVLEEADVFAPQNPQGDDSQRLHGEIDWIARRGRFRGFRLITITQRPARLSKDVLTQCSTLIAHRLPSPQDREAVKAWVDGNGDRDKAKEVFDTLAGLAVGEAWVWAPEHDVLERMRFPVIKTLDTSSTPKAGERRIEPKTLAEVDVSAIRAALESAKPAPKAKPASTEDARTALKSIGEAAAKLEAEKGAIELRGYERGEKAGFDNGRAFAAREILAGLRSYRTAMNETIEGLIIMATELGAEKPVAEHHPPRKRSEAPASPPPPAATKPVVVVANGTLNSAARKMLAVLDTNPPVRRSWTHVATLAGLKARGGHFNAGRKSLIDGGLIVERDGLVEHASPSPGSHGEAHDPAALVETWAAALSGAAPKILRFLFDSGGAHPRDDIALHLGMQPRGGHWNTAWKELRDNAIVTIDGNIARLTELFRP